MALKYEDIKEPFLEAISTDKKAQQLLRLINEGHGTYSLASEYAARVGEALGRVLRARAPLESVFEWDIEDLIPKSLGLDQSLVSDVCRQVQEELNEDAGLGIKFQEPRFDGDRAYGIVEELRSNPEFVNIEASFYDQLVNFSQNIVDESIRTNARVASDAGIETSVIRTADAKACKWCRAQAGTYRYEDVKRTGDDVWRRHENCRCTIDYITSRNGSRYVERVNNYRNAISDGDVPSAVTRTASAATQNTEYFDQMLLRLLERYNFTNANDQQIRSLIRGLPLVAEDSRGLLRALRRRTNVKG